MISPENGQEILDAVGEGFQHALIDSVDQARIDLLDFRKFRSEWFPTFTQRFISGFIHERVWAELVRRIDGLPGSTIIDEEPVREIGWMDTFKMRVKRHRGGDVIAAFPTESARRWYSPMLPLEGLEVTHLAVGYKWIDGQIGPAVISYRESLESRALWAVTIERELNHPEQIRVDDVFDEAMPQLDLSGFVESEEETGTDEQ